MASVSLTGSDVVVINGRIFNDMADGDFAKVDFETDMANMKVSKDGNTIFALNETGRQSRVTLRVLLGSADDVFLNSLLQGMLNDFASFNLLTGSFTKRVGDGAGTIKNVAYNMANGIFRRWPSAKSNAEGDVEQSVAVYEFAFRNQSRTVA